MKTTPQTVKDLREFLEKIPDDTLVILSDPDTNWRLVADWYYTAPDKEVLISGEYENRLD